MTVSINLPSEVSDTQSDVHSVCHELHPLTTSARRKSLEHTVPHELLAGVQKVCCLSLTCGSDVSCKVVCDGITALSVDHVVPDLMMYQSIRHEHIHPDRHQCLMDKSLLTFLFISLNSACSSACSSAAEAGQNGGMPGGLRLAKSHSLKLHLVNNWNECNCRTCNCAGRHLTLKLGVMP